MQINYNKAIADTAKEYCKKRTDAEIYRTDELYAEQEFLYGKLCWMIDAEREGWNPDDFEPSCIY